MLYSFVETGPEFKFVRIAHYIHICRHYTPDVDEYCLVSLIDIGEIIRSFLRGYNLYGTLYRQNIFFFNFEKTLSKIHHSQSISFIFAWRIL